MSKTVKLTKACELSSAFSSDSDVLLRLCLSACFVYIFYFSVSSLKTAHQRWNVWSPCQACEISVPY